MRRRTTMKYNPKEITKSIRLDRMLEIIDSNDTALFERYFHNNNEVGRQHIAVLGKLRYNGYIDIDDVNNEITVTDQDRLVLKKIADGDGVISAFNTHRRYRNIATEDELYDSD